VGVGGPAAIVVQSVPARPEPPVYIATLVLQFLLSIGLVFLVLIHSGRGGGLSDMFGGGLGASAAGSTVMEKNLDRLTVIVALLFAFNSVILALVIDR